MHSWVDSVLSSRRQRRMSWELAGLLLAPGLASARTLHVDADSPRPRPPYATLATAAHTLQDAVNAAADGDVVKVQPGRYDQGGALRDGQWNRVVVDKAITVRSAGGAELTLLAGARDPAAPLENHGCGPQAVRGVYLAHPQARLVGFRVTGGATLGPPGEDDPWEKTGRMGGGVYAAANSAVIRQCILDSNAASFDGGGLYGGTVRQCTLSGNWAGNGGGAAGADLADCRLAHNTAYSGGGAYECALRRCEIRDNVADCECEDPDSYGGGVAYSQVEDSGLHHNMAITGGGGAYVSDLRNCQLTHNVSASGGGAEGGTLRQCTVANNRATEEGGGTQNGTTYDCVIRGNRAFIAGADSGGWHSNALMTDNAADLYAGGASFACLFNCTIVSNRSLGRAGGTYHSLHVNTIVYHNRAEKDPETDNWEIFPHSYWPGPTSFFHSCTFPLPPGPGNTDAPPGFQTDNARNWMEWTDFRPAPDSPCVDAGNAALVTNLVPFDLDGLPRVTGAAIDIGACEHPAPAPLIGAIYVDATQSNSPVQDGSRQHPFATIQAGIDAATPGGEVILRSGRYTGPGNQNVSFRGKPLVVHAETNWTPTGVVIDCERNGRAFVFNQGETDTSILRGIIIRNGLATNGGAIYCSSASPLVEKCTLDHNTAYGFGGAVFAEGSRGPRLAHCCIVQNSARIVWQANYWGGQGAGLYSQTKSPARIEDSSVAQNTGESTSNEPVCGGIQGAWNVVHCSVNWHNTVAMVGIRDVPWVEDCEINYNTCGIRDVALLHNSRIRDNRSAGVCFSRPGTATHCRIDRNTGTGVYILPSGTGTVDIAFSEILRNGSAASGAPNLKLQLADCRITDNGGGSSAGMGYIGHTRCTITNNGSVASAALGAADFHSCLIRGNRGPAFTATKGGIRLDNCTLVGNGPNPTNGPTLFQGGYNGWFQVRNSILWNNGTNLYAHSFQPPSSFSGLYSLIQHSSTLYTLGEGGLDEDPQFVSATNFHLRPSSPCLGAGLSAYTPAGGDLEGHAWTTPPAMGAYALPVAGPPESGLAIRSILSPVAIHSSSSDASPASVQIGWDAQPDRVYTLMLSTNLLQGFQPSGTFSSGAGGPLTWTLPEWTSTGSAVFYHLQLDPAAD